MTLATRALVAAAARGKAGAVVATRADLWRSGVRRDTEAREVPGRAALYRSLWEDAAAACGAAVEDRGDGFLAISRAGRRTLVWNNQVPLDNPVTLAFAAHKGASGRALAEAGLPVPEQAGYTVADLGPARRFLEGGASCVVKPGSGTGAGAGVTCGVRTEDDLRRASARASRWSERLVVEQQAEGREYRVLVLDGQVLGTIVRRPPTLVGDGRSTVAALVAAENRRRVAAEGRAGLWRMALDLDALLDLARQGLAPRAVPAEGTSFTVGVTANENGPADNETVAAPPALARTAAAAAEALGLRLASVEVVTPDPAVPLPTAGGVVVEVNGTPGLHYHRQVADPSTAADVFAVLARTLLAEPLSGERPITP
jgi:cyanophycin synthetase